MAANQLDGNNVLVLALYPGIEVFGCAGAILHHTSHGDRLQVSILSDEAGKCDEVKLRRNQSLNAAKILGYGAPDFWEIPQRGIEYGEQLIIQIASAIRISEVTLVYAPSIQSDNPDHQALAMAAVEAVRRHTTKLKLAMYGTCVPSVQSNMLLDISAHISRKRAAMACFVGGSNNAPYVQSAKSKFECEPTAGSSEVKMTETYLTTDDDQLKIDVFRVFESRFQVWRKLRMSRISSDLPLVSVLIRSMDRLLLCEALNSVALQTYSNIEVVVINARAIEHSELGVECGSFPLRLVSTGTSLRRSRAANVGLDSACGKYIMFLDDDDWLAPDHIHRLMQALKNDSNCRVAYAGVEFRDERREKLELTPFNEPYNAGRLRGGNYIPVHAVLFEQTLLQQKVRFDEALDVYEDWDFLLQLSQHTNFVHVSRICAYYRASGTSNVGVYADTTAKRQAREKIFSKWKGIWTGKQIDELVAANLDIANGPLFLIRRELDVANAVSNQRQIRLTELEKIIAGFENTLGELQAANLTLREHNIKLEENSAVLKASVTELGEAAVKQKAMQSMLNEEIINRDRSIHVINEQMRSVLSSTSWRWSAPVRWVGKLLLGRSSH